MLDHPVAVSDEENTGRAYESIIIFELKKPLRDDYTASDNPIQQMLGYVDKLKTNKVKDKDGRIINVDPNTQFYLYAVCDITPNLLKVADDRDFVKTPDGRGYYRYHDKKKAYIEISAHARLAFLQNPEILRILDDDDIDIRSIGEGVYNNPDRKTAVFCIIPDNDKSYNFLIGVFYSQTFQELYYVADFEHDGSLPVPVVLWMDEFANVALPDGFVEILSTMRSRNISCNIILQNKAQLQALFKDSYQTVIGNCDATVYLGGNESETHKFISEMLGRYTVDKQSTGETRGQHGSSSRNFDVLGRELLMPDEVRKLDNSKCIVFIRGFEPVIDDKCHTWEREEYIASQAMGLYEGEETTEKLYKEGQLNFHIYAEGENGLEKSYRYQIENYQAVFQEGKVLEIMKKLDGRYLAAPDEFGTYMYRHDGVQNETKPVIDPGRMEVIESGGGRLHMYPVIGCYDVEHGEMLFISKSVDSNPDISKKINEIFRTANYATPKKKMLLNGMKP